MERKGRDTGRRSKASRWEKGYREAGQRPQPSTPTGGWPVREQPPARAAKAPTGRAARRCPVPDEAGTKKP